MRPAIRGILLVAALTAPAFSHTIDDFFDGASSTISLSPSIPRTGSP